MTLCANDVSLEEFLNKWIASNVLFFSCRRRTTITRTSRALSSMALSGKSCRSVASRTTISLTDCSRRPSAEAYCTAGILDTAFTSQCNTILLLFANSISTLLSYIVVFRYTLSKYFGEEFHEWFDSAIDWNQKFLFSVSVLFGDRNDRNSFRVHRMTKWWTDRSFGANTQFQWCVDRIVVNERVRDFWWNFIDCYDKEIYISVSK